MTRATKIGLIAAVSFFWAGSALANIEVSQPSDKAPNPLINISETEIGEAETVFSKPLDINISLIEAETDITGATREEMEYSSKLDLDYHLTEEAFIGVAKIQADAPMTGKKGGFPAGRHINPYKAVAGGGVKTKF